MRTHHLPDIITQYSIIIVEKDPDLDVNEADIDKLIKEQSAIGAVMGNPPRKRVQYADVVGPVGSTPPRKRVRLSRQ